MRQKGFKMYYKASKDVWIERIKMPDGKIKEISAKTQKSLSEKLIAFQKEEKKGRSFKEIADLWSKHNFERVSYNTDVSYSAHVERAKKYFGEIEMKNITPDMIQGYVDSLAEMDFARDTVRRGLVIVNRIFKYYITLQNSDVRFNPCSSVEIPKGLSKGRRKPPTADQLMKIKPDGEMGLFAYFMLYTGLRNGELLALRWEDIDRKKKIITVNKSVEFISNKPHVKNKTKTEAGIRQVPLLDKLNKALPKGKSGYVFGGEEPMTKMQLYREWTKWCAAHGLAEEVKERHYSKTNNRHYEKIKYKPLVTPYQFRHEYASMLEDAGVGEYDAMTAMGHSSIEVTKNIYTHIKQDKHQSRVAEKMNSYIENEQKKVPSKSPSTPPKK